MTDTEKLKALGVTVEPLVWVRSGTGAGWDGDYHTIPTGYTIRGTGNEEYRLSFAGGFSHGNSSEMMMERAQADHERRILSALTTTDANSVRADALREAAAEVLRENQRRIDLASIRIPAMASEIHDAIIALIDQPEGGE